MSSQAEVAVLIVDDDPDISRALTDFLEHEGYRVHLADTGAQALTQARQQRYDAVILDLGLPDRDGFEVLKVLLEIDPKLPVIVLTAFTTQDKAVGALSQGAFAFLTKPYNREQLKATLSQAIGVKTLVTRAETAQSALIATEERLRSVMQSAIDAIIVADAQGRVLSWNKAAERIFGYGQQEMVGQNLTRIMPPRHREGHQRGLERLRAGGASKFVGQTLELDGLRKDGTEFPIEFSLAAWTTGGETYYCGIIRDVTEKKRTERALRASEERFRSLVTNIPGVVYRCACDPDWTMEYINDAIEELCGYPASDFLANRVRSYASVIHSDDRAMVERVVFEAVKAKRRYALEYRVVHADGGVRWVYEKGQGIFGQDGQVRWLDGVIFDITGRKQAEEDVRQQYGLATFSAGLGIVLTRSQSLRDMLGLCAEAIVEHLEAAFARIWLLNKEGTVLELQASAGLYTHLDGAHSRVPVGALKIGRIAERREPHLTNDVPNDPHISDREWARREGMVAFAGYPLIVENRLIGVVAMFARKPLTDYALTALASAANAMAVGIERKQTEELLRRKLEVEKVVAGFSGRFFWSSDFDQAVSSALADMGRISGASRAYMFLFRDQGAMVGNAHEWCADGVTTDIDHLKNLPSSLFPWWMRKLRAGEVIHIADVSQLPPEASAEKEVLQRQSIKALLVFPIYAGKELVGFVGFDNVETAGAWREEDFFLLRLAAEIIGTAIQRKRSGEALERLRRQQELILDSAGDGVYGLDRNGLTSFVNPAATRMLGWRAEDLIGRPMHPILHHSRPDGKPYPLEECPIYAAFKDGGVHSINGEVFWRKDGTSFPVEYVSTPIRERGDIVGAVVIFRDVSERQQADEALRASEARLQLALKSTNLGIWDWDLVTGSVVWSNEVERLFGLSPGVFTGTKEAFFEFIHPEDRGLVSLAIRRAVEDGTDYEIEHRIVRPDGSVRWLACAGQVFREHGGQAVRMLGTVMDVTSRKQSEATFRQSVTGRKQP